MRQPIIPYYAAAAVLALLRPACGFSPSSSSSASNRRGFLSSSSSSSSSTTARRMFTGIVEEMGEVISLETKDDMTLWDGSKGSGTEMVIKGNVVMDGAYLGCSISVNGVCLTATELDFEENVFRVGLAPETLRKTDLGAYSSSSSGEADGRRAVNLERASEIGGRNSGHFVQGHVDDVGTIVDRWVDENSLFFKIAFPPEHMRYVVPKGFVAIDGASLTVCDVKSEGDENWFTFMLVEYTQQKIIVPSKKVGDTVNVEVDVLGKYSERAWEAVVPKMEALERKVAELEEKVAALEEGGSVTGVAGQAPSSSLDLGDVVPKGFASTQGSLRSKLPETWVRAEQPTMPAKDLNPERDNRNGRGTDWVRTKQTFYDTNY